MHKKVPSYGAPTYTPPVSAHVTKAYGFALAIARVQRTKSQTQTTRSDSRTSFGMLACGPTKATMVLGTHARDIRQRPTCR
eukprot:6089785-Prymnesium_polylepis.1